MRVVARHSSIFRSPIARTPLSIVSRTSIAATHPIGSYHKTLTPNQSFARRQVANMSSQSTQSQACCNTPAVVSNGYSPKGDYIEVDGLKTCKSTVSIAIIHYLTCKPRRHRPQRCKTRHSCRLRHLRFLQPNPSRRRHPRLHRQRPPVPGLHARFL
jgi:hypothetical protein